MSTRPRSSPSLISAEGLFDTNRRSTASRETSPFDIIQGRHVLDFPVDGADNLVLEVVQDPGKGGVAEDAVIALAETSVLSVLLPRLPDDLVPLAWTQDDRVHGVVSAALTVASADVVATLDFGRFGRF